MTKKILAILVFYFIFAVLSPAQKSPDEFFNLTIGADKTLVAYPEIIKYFKFLDQNSDLIKLSYEGESTLKNKMYVAFVSSSENIKNLDSLIEINKKLANPDKISKQEADGLIKKAKTFVLITTTIHATEIGASQYIMQLAHELVSSRDKLTKDILDDVVVLIMPSINPDGVIMVTDWYKKHLNTKYEGSRMPYLYHHYAGHDTNRDFYMLNLKESQIVNNVLHHKYFPHIFLDMHQMGSTGPRMFVPPFKDPLNQNLDPLLIRMSGMIGSFMSFKLQEKGKTGVANSYAFDAYWPGGSKNTAWFKNVVGILTELASVKIASPIYIDKNELRVRSKGLPEYKAQVNFPDPWKGGWWRLKDIIEYEKIAVDALLETASNSRNSFVSNFYKLGLKNIEAGRNEKPYAYIIPPSQWDIPASYTFLKKMKRNGIRIFKLNKDSIIEKRFYKKGSFVIPMDQPYRNFIKVMMEKQKYPEIRHMRNGPIIEPYDSSGWTLPIQMGVKYEQIDSMIDKSLMTGIKEIDYPKSIIETTDKYYSISAKFNRSAIIVNRLHKNKIRVYRYKKDNSENTGDFIIDKKSVTNEILKRIIAGTGVDIKQIKVKKENLRLLKPSSIAIYQPYASSMDEGWTRWVLDNFEFKYKIIHAIDLKKAKGIKDFDLIIFADIGRKNIVEGKNRRNRVYNMPPEYKDGIGKEGVKVLKNFVKKGGSIILMDSAYNIASKDFKLPFVNIFENTKRDVFYTPGTILKLDVNPNDPIAWGMEKDNFIFFSNSPAFRTYRPSVNGINRKIVARFNDSAPHLISGYVKGEKLLNRAVQIIRFDYYKGKVIVLGGRVQHRAQTFGTFKFLFNSIYYSGLNR